MTCQMPECFHDILNLIQKQLSTVQVKWFPAGNILNDIKIFHLTIFNIVWGDK
jgi:hypothetical protein